MYYRVIGALILLIGIIVLIKYIMRTGETKNSCAIRNEISPPDDQRNDDEVAEGSGIEMDIKEDK